MRRTVIAGNWKMNMTPSETKAFITELAPMVKGLDKCDIVLCVPAIDIPAAVEAAKGTNVKIGALISMPASRASVRVRATAPSSRSFLRLKERAIRQT